MALSRVLIIVLASRYFKCAVAILFWELWCLLMHGSTWSTFGTKHPFMGPSIYCITSKIPKVVFKSFMLLDVCSFVPRLKVGPSSMSSLLSWKIFVALGSPHVALLIIVVVFFFFFCFLYSKVQNAWAQKYE